MKKHYLVYKTTNLVNGKIYIGKHETDNLDDGYLGSGKLLKRAIEKYGEENFKREILFECSTREEMNAKEAELVNEEFLKRDDVYNIKLGGEGGFDFINTYNLGDHKSSGKLGQIAFMKRYITDEAFRTKMRNCWSSTLKHSMEVYPEKFRQCGTNNAFYGRHHTKETKQKIREKNSILLRGECNGSFGTVWIYNERLKQNKKVKKEAVDDFLKQGWKLGRDMSFYK